MQESKGDDFDYVFQENLALTVLEMMERWAKEWDWMSTEDLTGQRLVTQGEGHLTVPQTSQF